MFNVFKKILLLFQNYGWRSPFRLLPQGQLLVPIEARTWVRAQKAEVAPRKAGEEGLGLAVVMMAEVFLDLA